jgi:hypothetical protein
LSTHHVVFLKTSKIENKLNNEHNLTEMTTI